MTQCISPAAVFDVITLSDTGSWNSEVIAGEVIRIDETTESKLTHLYPNYSLDEARAFEQLLQFQPDGYVIDSAVLWLSNGGMLTMDIEFGHWVYHPSIPQMPTRPIRKGSEAS